MVYLIYKTTNKLFSIKISEKPNGATRKWRINIWSWFKLKVTFSTKKSNRRNKEARQKTKSRR